MAGVIYAFGDCEIDSDRYDLRRGGARVPVEPQVFDVLCYLVEHHDRVVTEGELLDSVWRSGSVEAGRPFVMIKTVPARKRSAETAGVGPGC